MSEPKWTPAQRAASSATHTASVMRRPVKK